MCFRCWMVSGFLSLSLSVVVALEANPVAVSNAVMANAINLVFMVLGYRPLLSVIAECCLVSGYRHASYARVVATLLTIESKRTLRKGMPLIGFRAHSFDGMFGMGKRCGTADQVRGSCQSIDFSRAGFNHCGAFSSSSVAAHTSRRDTLSRP
jgi:hypothetical protein